MTPHDALARLVAAVEASKVLLPLFRKLVEDLIDARNDLEAQAALGAAAPTGVKTLRPQRDAKGRITSPLAPSDATVPQTIEQAWHTLEARRLRIAELESELDGYRVALNDALAINGTLENVGDDLRARLAARESERDTFQAGYLAEADMRVKAEARLADTPENVERVARALFAVDRRRRPIPLETASSNEQDHWRAMARAALAAWREPAQ